MKNPTIDGISPKHPMPFVRLDLVLLTVKDGCLQVLLSHRKGAPFKGQWGLPGGALRIDLDASLESGAQRVANERLGRTLPNLSQVGAVGGANRDPRALWAMTVVYRSLVQADIETTPGKRVQALQWRAIDDIAESKDLAFDHAQLIAQSVHATRQEIRDLRFPAGWVPETFTLGELQSLSEAVLGTALDKVTFRRRMDVSGVAVAVEGQMRSGGAHRPAQVFRFQTKVK